MKPSFELLRPRVANVPAARGAAVATPTVSERELLIARKQSVSRDLERLQVAAKGDLDQRLAALLAGLRRDTSGRPPPVAGAVTVRVMGASCNDKTPVPLPKLRVLLEAGEGISAQAISDVTGLAVLVPRREEASKPGAPEQGAAGLGDKFEYRLRVLASDGSTVAHVETDPTRTHLLHLGEQKPLEGHAVLGRGWLAKLDQVAADRSKLVRGVEDQVAGYAERVRERLKAIDRRLELKGKKA